MPRRASRRFVIVIVALCALLFFASLEQGSLSLPDDVSVETVAVTRLRAVDPSPTDGSLPSLTSPIASGRIVGANGAANRSPPRDATPLNVSGGAPLERRQLRCWDHHSRPTVAPSWADAFFQSVQDTATYHALHAAVEHDPWTILIAWAPGRFMENAASGRRANGEVMEAPTRGRDYRFYLREYNASWHHVTRGLALPIVFQLGHRNAIAVCVRERIHLYARRCSVDGLPPLLLHSCLCRKCEEGTLTGATPHQQRMPGHVEADPGEYAFLPSAMQRFPPVQRLSHPLGRDALSGAPQSPSPVVRGMTGCLSVTCAPWLVTKDVVPRFDHEDLSANLEELLARVADERKNVMVVFFNAAWVDHLYNWVYSMCNRAGQTRPRYIVATLDNDSHALCTASRLPCFDAARYAEYEDDPALHTSGHTRKVTESMSWIKPRLALEVLGLGYGFWMVDLDISWNRSPDGAMPQGGGDTLVHQCDAPSRFSINSGFYLARPRLAPWLFFSNMMTFRPDENSDQTAMRLFARYDHTHGLQTECLHKWAFDMKCNYKVGGSVRIVQGRETFEWRPFNRNRTKFSWVLLHATCLNGAAAKIKYFRTMNAWFLDDLDASAVNGKPFCWSIAGNATIVQLGAATPHSINYPTETDPIYLEPRH